MNRIVDVKHNTFFTEDHLELHCKFVNKDKDTCREPHLYGSEQPLGLAYVDTKLLKYDDIDWDFEGEFGVQLPRIGGNKKKNKIKCDIEEGFNLATPPAAVVKLDKPTLNGKWYIPLNGRTRKSIVYGIFHFTNLIFDVYTLTKEHFRARYRVAGFKFNKPDNPASPVTKNELIAGVREAIQEKEEGLIPIKLGNGIDESDFLKKIRIWFDKVLGSPIAGGRYTSNTRATWAAIVLGNFQDENPAHTASVRSWLDKESREKWRKSCGYLNTDTILYIDAVHDAPAYAIRDALTAWENSGGKTGTLEIRVVVNMKIMDAIDLVGNYKKRKDKFKDGWNKQINQTMSAFGENCKRSTYSRIKLYAAYPALKSLHGDMSEWVYYE